MKRDLNLLANTVFDLLVIGGGIYGACIAWEASRRGLSVALIERGDFGHATSANSLKTVHGGLRYLQNIDFKRMRESIRERTTLMRIAPHLVHPLPCLMPTYGHSLRGRELMSAVLKVNDLVSFDRNQQATPDKHLPSGSIISREECLQLLPDLREDGLTGGAIWYDCQMYNSERLTLSFVKSAAQNGAVTANYVQAIDILQESDRVVGARARDELSGDVLDIRAKMAVNAAGPWVDQVLGLLPGHGSKLGLQLAKALNVATRPLFAQYAVALQSQGRRRGANDTLGRNGRLLFVAPWRNQSLIGTSYTFYDGHPDEFAITASDVQELLDDTNWSYSSINLRQEDVRFVYGGLVPISRVNPKTGAVERAKHYKIYDHRRDGLDGLISVLGVKYTTARHVAEKVIDQLFIRRGQVPPRSTTATTALYGGDIEQFEAFAAAEVKKQPCGLSADQLLPLVHNYGTAYMEVLRYFDRCPDGHVLGDEEALLRARILHSIDYEMAQKLGDVLYRRTESGTLGHPDEQTLRYAAEVMGHKLGWGANRVQEELCEAQGHWPAGRK